MGKDHIGYDELVDNALRGAMREVLLRVAEDGLLGSHHLYITFRTSFPGVDIPSYLRERYPDELTIVLQHQFWGLEVDEHGFAVTLSFNQVSERLEVPYEAMVAFLDPSVNFGLQFQSGQAANAGEGPDDAISAPQEGDGDEDEGKTGEIVALDNFRKK